MRVILPCANLAVTMIWDMSMVWDGKSLFIRAESTDHRRPSRFTKVDGMDLLMPGAKTTPNLRGAVSLGTRIAVPEGYIFLHDGMACLVPGSLTWPIWGHASGMSGSGWTNKAYQSCDSLDQSGDSLDEEPTKTRSREAECMWTAASSTLGRQAGRRAGRQACMHAGRQTGTMLPPILEAALLDTNLFGPVHVY